MTYVDFSAGFMLGGVIGFVGGIFAAYFSYIADRERADIKKIESMIDWIDKKSEVKEE
jgi:hypothetical protein